MAMGINQCWHEKYVGEKTRIIACAQWRGYFAITLFYPIPNERWLTLNEVGDAQAEQAIHGTKVGPSLAQICLSHPYLVLE